MSLYGTLATTTFKNAAGSTIARPQFMAYGTWGYYTHNFTTSDNTSYTNQSGRQAFPAYDNVSGINTTGFTTSSTPGSSYYDIPLDGIYVFAFKNLIDSYVNAQHCDAAFHITDTASNTWRALAPWASQYLGQNSGTYAPVGFNRFFPNFTGTGLNFANGVTVVSRFYQGQRIRPMIAMNASFSASIYGNGHNYFHGTYIGA